MDFSFNQRGWILVLAAVALVAWWILGQRPADVAEQAKTTAGQVVQNLSVDGVDLKSSMQKALDGLKTTLQGVSDETSAKAALPDLEKGAKEFDRLRELATKLPAGAKGAMSSIVATLRPALDQLFDKVLAIPGVNAIAKPVIDGLRAKLDALSKA